MLQEHWLYTSQFHLFDDICAHKTVLYNGISAMDPQVLRHGRPHGGCAILWRADLNYDVCKIDVTSSRLVCVSFNMKDGVKGLLFNLYMPTDDRCNGENLQIYQDVLAEVASICNAHNVQFVFIAGDFNTDMSRKSMFVDELKHFCNNELFTLCSNLDISSVDYTFESMANRSRSLIDHMLISNNCKDVVSAHFTIDDIENASDHLAVGTHVNIDCEYFNNSAEVNNVKRTAWYKANINDINLYKIELDNLLEKISLSNDCVMCRNFWCHEHTQEIEQLYKEIVNACTSASKVIPSTGKGSCKQAVPGWKQYCESERKVAMYWHNAWKHEGRPRQGFLAEARRRSRMKYHRVVKKIKKHENVIRSERMVESITADGGRKFWKEAKALRGNKGRKSPDSVEGQSGNEPTANLFANKFSEIYNNVGYNRDEMNTIMSNCNVLLSGMSQDKFGECLVSIHEVENCIKNLKKGKADGNIGLFSDHIIHGTSKLFKLLTMLINSMIIHGVSPKDLLIGTIIPIPKHKRLSVSNSDNFRGICLQSVICKIIDLIILTKEGHRLQTSDLQFGFKPGVSASTAAAVVHETLDYYVSGKGGVYVLSLDATKAFDRVDYVKLFNLLIDRKVSPLYIRLIYSMYINQQLCVNFNNSTSQFFRVSNGVKQGGVLSPTLFSCYLDAVIKRLLKAKVGCYIGECYTGCVAYADDVILLSPSRQALCKQIDIIEKFAIEYSVKFNGSKSKLMYVSGSNINSCNQNCNILVANQVVPCVDNINYLGHTINCNRNESLVEDIKRDFIGKFNSVLSDFSCINSHLKQQLVERYCYSFYGSHFCDFRSKHMNKLNVAWRKSVRKTWKVPYKTHCCLIPFIADCVPVDTLLHQRYYKFFVTNLGNQNCTVSFIFQNSMHLHSRLGRNYSYIMQKYRSKDILTSWIENCCSTSIRQGCMIREVVDLRDSLNNSILSQEECKVLLEHLCTM